MHQRPSLARRGASCGGVGIEAGNRGGEFGQKKNGVSQV
jgi:hypothetical protein